MNLRRSIILFDLIAVVINAFFNKADTSVAFGDCLSFTELFRLVHFLGLLLFFIILLVFFAKISSLLIFILLIYKLLLFLVHFVHLVGHLIFQIHNFVLQFIHLSCVFHCFNFYRAHIIFLLI